MSFTHEEKQWLKIAIEQLANSSQFNSNAIRQLALAELYRTNGRHEDASAMMERVKDSLEGSDGAANEARASISVALGLPR